MYQIKAMNGYEIQVKGDLCRVISQHYTVCHIGTYDSCVAWLGARGLRTI